MGSTESVRVRARLLLLCLCVIMGCSQATGPVKYPVSGMVTVNGEPAEGVAVVFHHNDAGLPANLRYPTAVSDAEGLFQISSTGNKDGAVAGEYAVTFTWLSSSELDAFDMFNGALGIPATTRFKVVVPVEDHGQVQFDIEIPEEQIHRSRPSAKGAGSK